MQLETVSLTGADNHVSVDDLNAIVSEYPFAEFAILLMPEEMGNSRFPDAAWINNFARNYKGRHKAMHLCGSAFTDFVDNDPVILGLMRGFKRIQLNLKFGDVDGKYDPEAMIERIKTLKDFIFIIQYTEEKAPLLEKLADITNHTLLFDASAGQGISPDSWPVPIDGHKCGYAGGINPDNVVETINKISAVAPSGYQTWIDMETGIRTDDCFDLAKARQVLEISSKYII